MTLFDECRDALSADFEMVEELHESEVIDILYKYPFMRGSINWSEIKYLDYENIDALLSKNAIENDYVFVLADDEYIPIFRSRLSLIAKNIYDVTALSPKMFISNDKFILQPLFPTDMFRLGIKE